MTDAEGIGDHVGDGAVAQEVEVVEIDLVRLGGALQAAFYEGACRATGAVLKDDLRAVGRSLGDLE